MPHWSPITPTVPYKVGFGPQQTKNYKQSNPKQAQGIRKVPFHVIPSPVMAELGLALLEGSLKYGAHNYRDIGVRSSTYYDACLRHLMAYWEGQDIDEESGIPHITKAIACLTVLRDSQIIGNDVDDRPIKHKDNWQRDLNTKAGDLIDKYPEPKKAYTQK